MKNLIIFFLFTNIIYSQYDVPITLLNQFNGKYDFTIIGNTQNEFDNYQNPPPPCQMLTQSSATLNLLSTQNIVAAYFIWSGIGNGQNANIELNGNLITADQINVADVSPIEGFFTYFSSSKNITTYVQSYGNGTYSV